MLEGALENAGYEVVAVDRGTEALPHLKTAHFDLLLSDIVMPGGMTGYQLAELVSAERPGVRILFTSGYTELAAASGHGARPAARRSRAASRP